MAKDLYHDAVKEALIKEGWAIIKEPYRLYIDDALSYYIDIFAKRWIIARKETEWILVEVKSFNRLSTTYEFHSALGQYITYQTAIEYLKLDKKLLLAVPIEVFNDLFQHPFIKFIIEKHQVQLLPYDPDEKILIK